MACPSISGNDDQPRRISLAPPLSAKCRHCLPPICLKSSIQRRNATSLTGALYSLAL